MSAQEHAGSWPEMLRTAWAQALRPILAAAFFAAAGWFLWRELRHLSWHDLTSALAETSPSAFIFSIFLTLGSYACLAGTEALSLRALGHRLSFLGAARVAVPAYALTNSAGFSPATGTLFRVQMYRKAGLNARTSALVALVAGVAVTLSGLVTAGLVMLADPGSIGAVIRQPMWRTWLLGAALASPAMLWFLAFTPSAPRWLGGRSPSRASSRARAVGLATGIGDWLFSSAALFVLLPDAHLAIFPGFLCAYIVGALLSAATGVPGGLGVFEAIVLALTSLMSQAHETAAALLLYRCIYSLGPLAIWGAVTLVRSARRRSATRTDASAEAAPQGCYWARPIESLFAELSSSPEGINHVDAERRLQEHGPNRVTDQRSTSAMTILLRQLRSPLVLILVFAGVLSGALQEWINAAIILAMVSGTTLLGFFQEHRASHAIESLRHRLSLTTRVRRDGQLVTIPFSEIVPGDVVALSAGAIIPADAVVFRATDLLISQASLTGESFPVDKRPCIVSAAAGVTDRVNCAFAGSSVRSGTGEALVIRTGRGTEFGAIAEHLQRPPVETGFAQGIRKFGLLLLQVMFVIVLMVLIVNQLLGRPFIDSLLFSVALGLGMSPEMLPAIVSVTLSAGAVQLARKGVIVRQLESIENLGAMTVFCTDKTGTLTEGEIRMQGAVGCDGRPSERVRWLGFLNAAVEAGIRNPLDCAVVDDGVASGLKLDGVVKLGEVPYDFTRKRLSVVVEDGDASGQALMVLKGAVEHVFGLCATVSSGDQEVVLTSQTLAHLHDFASGKAMEGLRLLAVATRRLTPQPTYRAADEAQMRLEGFLVFLDPPKAEAVAAIAELRRLEVTVKVLSGDNQHVVRHVADQVGLRDARLLTGSDLAHLDEAALSAAAEQATLFAEVDPQQKERIVRALRRRGQVVGYLGDGINDAPSLYAADIGVSVDQAVDVARESADVVLLRRDLSVLRDGVIGGRRSFANTLKYINITTSANFGNMVSMALAAPLLPFLPMAAKQILLNNLLSDLPALAISTDRVDRDSLFRAQRLDTGQLRRFMIVFGLISSVFDLAAFAILLRAFDAREVTFQTAWFVLSLLTELVALFALRTHAPAWRSAPSRLLLASSLCVAMAAIILPYLEFAARLFDFEPLGPSMLLSMAALVIGYFAATEWAKEAIYGRRVADKRSGGSAEITR